MPQQYCPYRKIIHVDLDAFYPSVEVLDNPQLKGKPVAVGGSPEERGVIASASYEARAFGVRSAQSSKVALRLCPHLILLPPRFERYRELSLAMRNILLCYTDLIEPLSLDECYLDVTQNKINETSATRIAQVIQMRIERELGLTASLGVAPLKFLAKVASDLKKPRGLTVIPPERVADFLRTLPVGKLWGVGPATEKKLQSFGILYAGELAQKDDTFMLKHFGKFGLFIRDLARGIDPRPVEPPQERKQIGREVTLPHDIYTTPEALSILEALLGETLESVRKRNFLAQTLTLKVRFAHFDTLTRSKTLTAPSVNPTTLLTIIKELWLTHAAARAQREGVRLLGVSLSHFIESESVLFMDTDD